MALLNQAAPAPQAGGPKEFFRKMTLSAMKIMYDKGVAPGLLKMMQEGEPADAVARTAYTILDKLKETVKGTDPKAVYAVAPAVVALLLEMAVKAGIIKNDPAIMKAAMAALADLIRNEEGAGQPPAGAPPAAPMGAPPAMPPQTGMMNMQPGA